MSRGIGLLSLIVKGRIFMHTTKFAMCFELDVYTFNVIAVLLERVKWPGLIWCSGGNYTHPYLRADVPEFDRILEYVANKK